MDVELPECPPGDVLYDPAEPAACDENGDSARMDRFTHPPVGGFIEVGLKSILHLLH